ncbi:MAG: NUDIX domain-containing protein [Pseudomonadota bacterium]
MAHFAIQFGKTIHGKQYKERPSVYGICLGEGGKIAIARIGDKNHHHYDLPGGGIESEESDPEALIREFEEEVGIPIWPLRQMGRAGQYWINETVPVNSLASFYEVEITGGIIRPTEPDHSLVWMSVEDAVKKVRHDSHAWAILSWDRERYWDAQGR